MPTDLPSPRGQAAAAQLLQPPALAVVTHTRGANRGKQQRASAELEPGGEGGLPLPWAGGEAGGSSSPRALWGEEQSSLMVHVPPSRAKSTG